MAINLFQSSTNSTFNNSTPIQTQNNFSPSVPGSYRGKFKTERITYGQTDPEDQNTNLCTTNFFMQQEYKGISALQIRLEDYYLIRSHQIKDPHKSQIEAAVKNNNFNPKTTKSQNQQILKPPLFPDQGDIFKRSNNLFNQQNNHLTQPNSNQTIFNNQSNNNRTNIFPNNSNDLYNKNNNQPNIFQAPPPINQLNVNNNQSTNLFQQQSNNNSNNIFQQNNINRSSNLGNQSNNISNQSNNIFNQSNNNNFNQQQNNNIFTNQTLFSNNNLINSNNIFNQPLQPIQPALFQYPTNNNVFQPMVQASIFGPFDYLQFQENQFKDFTRQFDSQILMMEQQKQASSDEYDSMFRDSANMNFDYRLQNQYTQSMKSNQTYKLQNQKSTNLSNKTITCLQDKKTISKFQLHSLNTETRSNFIREDRKPISKFQENYQNNDSKNDFTQRNDRKSQSTFLLDLQIIFLESEKFLSISQEFQNKSRVYNVKQFVEEQLQNIDIFGSQSWQYFNNCLIYNNSQVVQDCNVLLTKLVGNILTFNYFYVKIPKLVNDGYLSNLHEFPNLKKVQNFMVSNKFGKIVWTQQTNIYYLDLDKIIDIKQESIEVYDTKKIHELLKPEIGVKLNSECYITFKFQLKNPQTNEVRFKSNLITQAQKQGLQFISIDFKNFEYTVKAFHFSGYHFNSDYSNKDNQNYQVQQQQVEIQRKNNEISLEQEENDSLSLEYQNDFSLQWKLKFDISFQNFRTQQKQIKNLFSNQINNKFKQENDQLPINTQLFQNYFNNQEQIISFQLLNMLFANPTINIVHFLQLQQNRLVSLQNIDKTPKIINNRVFHQSLFLKQFKIQFSLIELRESHISVQQQNLLSNVYFSQHFQPNSQKIIKLHRNDWRINKFQVQPLYEEQSWREFYTYQKENQIASQQKSKEQQKLYEYLYNNIHTYTIILFNIILRNQKTVSQSTKLIGLTIIASLLKSLASNQLIFIILEKLQDKVFYKKERIRVRSFLDKIGFINCINTDLTDIDRKIDKKQCLLAVEMINERKAENQYNQILNENILPYLVICDDNLECQIYLQEIEMDEIVIQNCITKNEYHYHLIQMILNI